MMDEVEKAYLSHIKFAMVHRLDNTATEMYAGLREYQTERNAHA